MRALAFGEILWDIIEGKKYLGGAPLNFSVHFVKCGGVASIISAVGNDVLGSEAIERINTLGVDTSRIATLPDLPTSTVDVFLNNGQPDYKIHENVAFDAIQDIDLQALSSANAFDIFYFGSLAQRSLISRNALNNILENVRFTHVFYDINLRKNYYSIDIIRYALGRCSVFKINDDEVQVVSMLIYKKVLSLRAFAVRVASEFAIKTIVITAGAKGCYCLVKDQFDYIPGVQVTVADTVGAGDAFSAAFMYLISHGITVQRAASIGNVIGAFVASSSGAIPDYPPGVKELLRNGL
jgi:fructokinase